MQVIQFLVVLGLLSIYLCISVMLSLKNVDIVLSHSEEEVSYFLDYKPSCIYPRSSDGSYYLVSKIFPECKVEGKYREKFRVVPVLLTYSVGALANEIYHHLNNTDIDSPHSNSVSDVRTGWWELFIANKVPILRKKENSYSRKSEFVMSQTLDSKSSIKAHDRELDEIFNKVLFSKVIHLVSDPIRTIDRGLLFCSNVTVWSKVALVTPFLCFYMRSRISKSTKDKCIRLLMYHWWSWNRILQQFSNDTYMLEGISSQVCLDSIGGSLNLAKVCDETIWQEQDGIRSNSEAAAIEVVELYRIDCELANRVFYLALEFGYDYDNVPHKCGLSE